MQCAPATAPIALLEPSILQRQIRIIRSDAGFDETDGFSGRATGFGATAWWRQLAIRTHPHLQVTYNVVGVWYDAAEALDGTGLTHSTR